MSKKPNSKRKLKRFILLCPNISEGYFEISRYRTREIAIKKARKIIKGFKGEVKFMKIRDCEDNSESIIGGE